MAAAVKMGVQVRRILDLNVLDNIARMKIMPWDSYSEQMDAVERKMETEFQRLFQELTESGMIPEHAV